MTRYAVPPPARPISRLLTPFAIEALGRAIKTVGTGSLASTAWPSANLALYFPVVIPRRTSFAALRAFLANGATANGNVDIGLYDESWNRLASTGSVAQSGTTTIQDLAALAVTIPPGRYYLGIALSSGTGTAIALGSALAGSLASLGVAQEASAFPLPATATPAVCAQTIVPIFGLSSVAVF
jgi:hypothetical protein